MQRSKMEPTPGQKTIWMCPYCSNNLNDRQPLYEHLLLRHNMDTHYALKLVTDMETTGSIGKAKECIANEKTIRFVKFNNLVQTREAEMDMNALISEADAMFDEAVAADKEARKTQKKEARKSYLVKQTQRMKRQWHLIRRQPGSSGRL
jgi:hypothetical protein